MLLLVVGFVTSAFLRVAGVNPILGRNFSAADNEPGAERVALINHALRQREAKAPKRCFGSDQNQGSPPF